jgi:hypothetical protein
MKKEYINEVAWVKWLGQEHNGEQSQGIMGDGIAFLGDLTHDPKSVSGNSCSNFVRKIRTWSMFQWMQQL